MFVVLLYMHLYRRRNLEYYDTCHNEKVRSCDSDSAPNQGELTIKIPKDTYSVSGLLGEAISLCSVHINYLLI